VKTIELGEPALGLWCRTCEDHTLMRFPVLQIDSDGIMPVGNRDVCPHCNTRVNRRVER
jgi:hypothetical protein